MSIHKGDSVKIKPEWQEQLERELNEALLAMRAADAARDVITDDTADEICAPLNAAYFAASKSYRAAQSALRDAQYPPTPAQLAAQAEQREACAKQLAASERLAIKDRSPVFAVRCQCGGTHDVSPDRKSCNDCR